MNRFKHAFAVDEPNVEPTDVQKEVANDVCREIVRRGLATPALVFLEIFRPLNYVGSQVMHFFQPIATLILDNERYRHMSEFLENRQSVDYLCRHIEELEDQCGDIENRRREAESGPGEPTYPSP